jgi:tryptophan synthase alpha chain
MTHKGWYVTRPLLICYAPLGDPEVPEDLLATYAEQGVNIVEVGIPTANPYLDGATVADSMHRALQRGNPIPLIHKLIEVQTAAIADRCRLVLMGYRDMAFAAFTDLARRRLIHGLIMADSASGESPEGLDSWLRQEAVARVGFVDSRLTEGSVTGARAAAGYVMLQAHDGPTGVRAQLDSGNAAKIRGLRQAGVDLPIALGFGIGTPQHAAAAIKLGADGVVVGSACVEAARSGSAHLKDFLQALRRAIDGAASSAEVGYRWRRVDI